MKPEHALAKTMRVSHLNCGTILYEETSLSMMYLQQRRNEELDLKDETFYCPSCGTRFSIKQLKVEIYSPA